jgi:hypothetical protein
MPTRLLLALRAIAMMALLLSACGSLAGAEYHVKRPQIEVTTNRNEKVTITLTDIVPSLAGTCCLSLTKKPERVVGQIVWHKVRLIEYSEETANLSEIAIKGPPLSRRYPHFVDETLFFPVRITMKDGSAEDWFWQGGTLAGFSSKGSEEGRVGIPLVDVKRIRFLGLSTDR